MKVDSSVLLQNVFPFLHRPNIFIFSCNDKKMINSNDLIMKNNSVIGYIILPAHCHHPLQKIPTWHQLGMNLFLKHLHGQSHCIHSCPLGWHQACFKSMLCYCNENQTTLVNLLRRYECFHYIIINEILYVLIFHTS